MSNKGKEAENCGGAHILFLFPCDFHSHIQILQSVVCKVRGLSHFPSYLKNYQKFFKVSQGNPLTQQADKFQTFQTCSMSTKKLFLDLPAVRDIWNVGKSRIIWFGESPFFLMTPFPAASGNFIKNFQCVTGKYPQHSIHAQSP